MQQVKAPSPGEYQHIPFADYLAWDIADQTELKAMGDSPAHYRAARDGVYKKEPTDDMMLGTALHYAFLEPELMPTAVIKWGDKARRGSAWDLFAEEHAEKIIMTACMYDSLIGMVRSLRKHQFVRDLVGSIDATEVSVVGDAFGFPMKGRADVVTPGPLVDLKKVRSNATRDFTNAIIGFGYHIQTAIYRELFNRDRFVMLTCEDHAPFDVVAFELSPQFLRVGETRARRYIERVRECEAADEWPGRCPVGTMTLEPPEWAIEASAGVTFDGEAIADDGQHIF